MTFRRTFTALTLALSVAGSLAIPSALAADTPVVKRSIPVESAVTTTHKTTIKGEKISYTATTAHLAHWLLALTEDRAPLRFGCTLPTPARKC